MEKKKKKRNYVSNGKKKRNCVTFFQNPRKSHAGDRKTSGLRFNYVCMTILHVSIFFFANFIQK